MGILLKCKYRKGGKHNILINLDKIKESIHITCYKP